MTLPNPVGVGQSGHVDAHNEIAARVNALSSTYVAGRTRTLYVETTGSDSNSGLTPGAAKATIQAAVDTLLGGVGGTIHVGTGTFAPFEISGATQTARGIHIIGAGNYATVVKATAAGDDALTLLPTGPMNYVTVEKLALTGGVGTGRGLNFGGNSWAESIALMTFRDLRIEDNGAGGILAHNINNLLFDSVHLRNNRGPAVRVTGRSTDGVGTVFNGNTNVWLNCHVTGDINTRGQQGYVFDQSGNSMTIIGGEVAYCSEGLVATSSGGQNGLSLLGVHFENNLRAAHIGDQAASGNDAQATFRSCFFNSNGAAGGTEEVLLDGCQQTRFEDCNFAGTTAAAIKEAAGRANRYVLDRCASGAQPLLTLADGSSLAGLRFYDKNGGARHVRTSASASDSLTGVAYYENAVDAGPIQVFKNSVGAVHGLYSGNGSPQGVITAGVGSIYLRTNGGSGLLVYVKASGTGNTGWQEISPNGPQPIITRTAAYTLTNVDRYVISNAAAAVTHTLLSATSSAIGPGKVFTIKNATTATGNVTVATQNSQTIDGALTDTIAVGASMTYLSDGANWHKIA